MAGMVDPLFRLISLVDKIVRLKAKVRGIPDAVNEILEAVGHARGGLHTLPRVLQEHRENFGDEHGVLERLDTDVNVFYSTLVKLETFIGKHAPQTDPNANPFEVAGRAIGWIINTEYQETVRKLRKDIATHIKRIEESKSTLLLIATSVIARNNGAVGRVVPVGRQIGAVPASGGVDFKVPFVNLGRNSSSRINIQPSPTESVGEPLVSSGDSTWSSATYASSIAGTVAPTPSIASKKSSRSTFTPAGRAKIWLQDGRTPSVIQRITFKRYGDDSIARLIVTDIAGVEREHIIPKGPISQTPYTLHRKETSDRMLDPRIRNLVKFFNATDYEYSFEDDNDYESFLRFIVRKTLRSFAEVDSIFSKRSKTAECALQNLQLWEDNTGALTITFYGSGGKERRFLEFKTTYLKLKKSTSDGVVVLEFTKRKAGKERTPEEELEKKMDNLKIKFTKQEGGREYSQMWWFLDAAGFAVKKQ
ncbi:MAG: hypothetical protein M1839_002183 [Geoglossum umbratile]|nr:MAG: hypothetical protein M1839_002183 [Geoglossum umbratile]